MKVMIVEDDPDVRQLLEMVLEEMNLKQAIFNNAASALAQVEKILPDLIIMDIMMPQIDGFELCQRLKNNSRTKHIPILAITGYDSKENRKKMFLCGADDYLAKPFDLSSITNKIRALLGLR